METREWVVRYVAYSGDIVRTTVEAAIDADECDVIRAAYDAEGGGYSSNYIHKVIDVE